MNYIKLDNKPFYYRTTEYYNLEYSIAMHHETFFYERIIPIKILGFTLFTLYRDYAFSVNFSITNPSYSRAEASAIIKSEYEKWKIIKEREKEIKNNLHI
jgi:hypothetical protein